jgi:hypothetical protein
VHIEIISWGLEALGNDPDFAAYGASGYCTLALGSFLVGHGKRFVGKSAGSCSALGGISFMGNFEEERDGSGETYMAVRDCDFSDCSGQRS